MKIVEIEEYYEIQERNVSQIAGAPNIQRVPVMTHTKVTRRPVEES